MMLKSRYYIPFTPIISYGFGVYDVLFLFDCGLKIFIAFRIYDLLHLRR